MNTPNYPMLSNKLAKQLNADQLRARKVLMNLRAQTAGTRNNLNDPTLNRSAAYRG